MNTGRIMKKYFKWVSDYRLDELFNRFFVSCGVMFIMLNIMNTAWPSNKEVFGGFVGQLLFALVIAVSGTYFSGRKQSIGADKIETN